MDVREFYNENAERHAQENQMKKLPQSFKTLLQYFGNNLPKQPKIIDAGCGDGRDGKYFQEEFDAEIVGVDIAEEMLKKVPFKTIRTSIEDLSMLENESFDGYWCPSTLYFLSPEEAEEAVQEANRVLKSGGIVHFGFKVVSRNPSDTGEKREMNKWGNSVTFRAYSIGEAQDLIQQNGFEILETQTQSVDEKRIFHNIIAKKK